MPIKKVKAFFFDFDGTLVDTEEFGLSAFKHALRIHGLPIPTDDEISSLAGATITKTYQSLSKLEDVEHLKVAHRIWQDQNMHLAVVFDKVFNVLKILKERGFKLAIVTARSRDAAHYCISYTQLNNFFDLIITGEDAAAPKPDPSGLIQALDFFGLQPHEAVMIGDTDIDVNAGKNAGTLTVGVTYGPRRDYVKQHQPDYIIDDIGDLLKLL